MAIVTNDTGKENDLVKASGAAPRAAPINTVRASSADYKSVAVDTRWTPRTNLLVHIEGQAWTVTYYAQVLDRDTQLSGQQLSISPVYQQYTKIVDMEMRVSNPLTSTQDESTKAMTLAGVAITYPFIIPNEGDMFVADVGEGRRGIFRVTNSIKKSIFKEACYEIAYSLDTDAGDKLLDLEHKAVKTLYFHKDFLSFGQNPLLVPSVHSAVLELSKVYDTLTRQYFKRFFSQEFQTLLVPGQGHTVYDAFLVNFLLAQFSTWDSPEVRKIRRLNVDDDETMRCDSLWRALMEKDAAYLNVAFKRAGLVSTRSFTDSPVMEGIRYTGISYAVYPLDPVLSVDGLLVNPSKLTGTATLVEASAGAGQLNEMVRAVNLQALPEGGAPSVYPVTQDDCYVLSAAFYHRTAQQSTLEQLVWTFLDGGALDIEQLVGTAKRFTQWGALEQFYYVPIVMVLIRAVQRGL